MGAAWQACRQSLQAAPRRWLVTGAAGFIGSNLVEQLLALDQQVVAMDNYETGFRHNLDDVRRLVTPAQWARLQVVEGDIRRLSDCRSACEGIELVLHPAAFRSARYIRLSEEHRIPLPAPDRNRIEKSGVRVVAARSPHILLGGSLLFLGEIPRRTEFEKGMLKARYEEGGTEKFDPIDDDSAVVAHVHGKGLVVLSGCAHSGIVNTVAYAREVTGVEPVFAVMGGFHLTGADFEPIIGRTTEALKAFNPSYIVPTHCTGRKASMHIEREMPEQFLLNMSGTKMVFAS
jgi:metal-dependent hydrolase (beta-lactamase superfamily II)